MVPIEIGSNSLRRYTYKQEQNNALMRIELDLLEKRCEQSQLWIALYQQGTTQYYNFKVKNRYFEVGDLVLR
ncbi:hypothetical protein PanWU01x14_124630 [Parasponia andersonii]|uniref:Uncharacterized protein n=1 Tax=Parasponia andersonii TaxID=3476 RepID=A0A2P5CTL6_PARAD|nr:hypothetical protein PanWU01x14_124630 [Parasponia andersonii]